MELTKTYRFEASHILLKHSGKCSRLHGHSWVLHVSVEGPVNSETGFVMDYGDISKVVKPLVERLDHRHLGEWRVGDNHYSSSVKDLPEDFYPTSENLLWWVAEQLADLDSYYDKPKDDIILRYVIEWSKLSLEETCTSRATLTRKEFDDVNYTLPGKKE